MAPDKAVLVQEMGSANLCSQRIDQRYCPIKSPAEQSKIFAEHLAAASACSPKEVCHKLLDYTPEVMLTAKRKTVLINYKILNYGSDCVWHVFNAFFCALLVSWPVGCWLVVPHDVCASDKSCRYSNL